jgi:glucose dehydrogenase
MKTARRIVLTLIVAAGALACVPLAVAQAGTSVNDGDWPNIHGEISSQRYSPLDQINAENVADLEIA